MSIRSVLNFSDYIKMLPSSWVFEHFIQGTDQSRKILSSSMIDEAVVQFSNPENLRSRFRNLEVEDRFRCALIYLCGNAGLETAAFRGLDNSLILTFLVYAAIDKSSQVRLFGFEEFQPILMEECLRIISERLPQTETVAPVSVCHLRVINDIAVTVSLSMQKQLKKKKNGGLTRASLLQLKKTTDLGSHFRNDGGEYVAGLIIAYCMSRNLVFETETEYLLNTSEFSNWLSLPMTNRYDDIVDFVQSFTGGWWLHLLDELLNKNVWIPVSIFPLETQDEIVNTLSGLRFAEIVEIKVVEKDLFFCKTEVKAPPAHNESREVVILPDFSAVIAQEVDSKELYQFTQIGTISTLDRVYKGKIDKSVLADALSRGIEGDHILEWLGKWQSPGNVTETIREWLREFYRLYITDRSFLVSADEKVTYQINSFTPLRSLIERVPAHAIYKIKKGSEEQVREILKNLGFDYRMPGQDLEYEIPLISATEQFNTSQNRWTPVTLPQAADGEPVSSMRGTKYGGELKALDMSEVVHVIDYATLTGQNLIIDYEGSPYIKEGVYTVKPISCQKGIEPILDAEIIRTHTRKQLYIKKIRKIGVQPT